MTVTITSRVLLGFLFLFILLPGCAWKRYQEVSEVYDVGKNRYRIEAFVARSNLIGNNVEMLLRDPDPIWNDYRIRLFSEERKLLFTKAKEHCAKAQKVVKVNNITKGDGGFINDGFMLDNAIIHFECVLDTP